MKYRNIEKPADLALVKRWEGAVEEKNIRSLLQLLNSIAGNGQGHHGGLNLYVSEMIDKQGTKSSIRRILRSAADHDYLREGLHRGRV